MTEASVSVCLILAKALLTNIRKDWNPDNDLINIIANYPSFFSPSNACKCHPSH